MLGSLHHHTATQGVTMHVHDTAAMCVCVCCMHVQHGGACAGTCAELTAEERARKRGQGEKVCLCRVCYVICTESACIVCFFAGEDGVHAFRWREWQRRWNGGGSGEGKEGGSRRGEGDGGGVPQPQQTSTPCPSRPPSAPGITSATPAPKTPTQRHPRNPKSPTQHPASTTPVATRTHPCAPQHLPTAGGCSHPRRAAPRSGHPPHPRLLRPAPASAARAHQAQGARVQRGAGPGGDHPTSNCTTSAGLCCCLTAPRA